MPKQTQPEPDEAVTDLDEPITVGELTLAEAKEIKALTALVLHYDRETQRLTDELARARQTLTAVQNQRVAYARQVVRDHGIDVDAGSFTLDEDEGIIQQTSVRVSRPALAAVE